MSKLKISDNLLQFVCDPRDGSSLKVAGDQLVNINQPNRTFPITGSLPWLFPDPLQTLADWKNRWDAQDARIGKQIENIKFFQKDRAANELTRKRVNRSLQAQVEHRAAVRKLLDPLAITFSQNSFLHEAVKTKIPQTQSLMSYYPNVFRDWVWGQVENEQCRDICEQYLDKSMAKMLVFGAGSGRLPIDLHQSHGFKYSLLSDINPFLVFCGQAMLSGKKLELYEFPVAPLAATDVAVKQKLSSPYGVIANVDYVFADALNPPVKPGAFDTIFTPWFIDIVPMDLESQVGLINSLLEIGGKWINFGSLVMSHSDPFKCYTQDELSDLFTKSGFKVVKMSRHKIPYLDSPHSAQSRIESVLVFTLEKVADVQRKVEPYEFLPDWITSDDQPIPGLPELQNLIMVNFIFAELLSAVGQGATITNLGEALAPKLNIPVDQSKEVIRALLTRVYEENLYNRNY